MGGLITTRRKHVERFESGGELYLRVHEPVSLRHQEHAALRVEPGEYLVRRQVETWLDEVRQVAD